METHILNYRIIIEPESQTQIGKTVYTALCPSLGVADWGKTVEEAISHIREGIQCHIESLLKHNEPIPPPDNSDFMIATTTVTFPKSTHITFS